MSTDDGGLSDEVVVVLTPAEPDPEPVYFVDADLERWERAHPAPGVEE